MKYEFFDVHHVSFDLWLTLIRSNPLFKKKRDELLKDFFSLAHSTEDISAKCRLWDVRFTAINERTGKNIHPEEMISIILADLGYDLEKINPETFPDYFTRIEELFFEYQPVLIEENLSTYLTALSEKGINLSVLSNTGIIKGKLLRKLLQRLEIENHFKFQVYSDEISFSKPSEEAFMNLYTNAMTHRPLDKKNILHIGDNKNADVFGASKNGMQGALVNSNNVSLLNLNIYKEKVQR